MSHVVLQELYPYILVFCRLGAMFIFLPALSAQYVSIRVRVGFVFALTLVVASPHPALPPMPELIFDWFMIITREILLGLFFGLTAGFITVTFEVAGAIASMSSSLAAAQMFNPSLGQQSNLISGFYGLVGITILFVSDLYLILLQAIMESFQVFPLLGRLEIADSVDHIILLFNQMFYVGVRMAAPVMLVNFIFSLSLAMLNRLMPTLQVFFLGMPAQIALSFISIAMSLSSVMRIFIETFHIWRDTGQLM